jgi:hypothetical protein
MNSIALFTLALGLEKPWIITKIDIDPYPVGYERVAGMGKN